MTYSSSYLNKYMLFFLKKSFIRKWASKTLKLQRNVKKSPASNAWASIRKNVIKKEIKVKKNIKKISA